MKLTTDEFLERIGSFGCYQIALAVFVNLGYALWWSFEVMVMVFIASEPPWRCKNNSTCPFTEAISIGHENYKYRCDISRNDWEFQGDFTSVVTEVKLAHRKQFYWVVSLLFGEIRCLKFIPLVLSLNIHSRCNSQNALIAETLWQF